MIKNAQEAREIIEKHRIPESTIGKLTHTIPLVERYQTQWSILVLQAEQYLVALTGPEWIERERIMKAVVDAAALIEMPHDTIISFKKNEMDETYEVERHDEQCRVCSLNKALETYRAAAKEIK